MGEWEAAVDSRTMKADSLKSFIPGYDYSAREAAQRTDETFCSLLVENLRVCKRLMFDVLETAYELHRELVLKDMQRLRDDIGLFTDEIRARAFKWDPNKSRKWLEGLVDYDYRILIGLTGLVRGIHGLYEEVLSSGKGTRELRSIDGHTEALKENLNGIVTLFRERDMLCNISEEALERSFEDMKADIRRGFGS